MKLEELFGAIVLVAIIAIVAGGLAEAENDFREDIKDGLADNQVTNETVVWSNNTYVALNNLFGLSCTEVWNITGEPISIDSSNWDCSDESGFNLSDNGASYNTSVFVTYTYKDKGYSYNISTSGLEGTDSVTSYMDNIGTLIGVTVMIGVIMGLFVYLGGGRFS